MNVTNVTVSLNRDRRYLRFGGCFLRDAAELHRKCHEVGCEEAERKKFNAFRNYWWAVFLLFIYFQSFSNSPFLPAAEPQSQDTPTVLLVQKFPCRLLRVTSLNSER